MWNSEKALNLWNFSQDEVRDSSPCKTCADFEECRRGKGGELGYRRRGEL